MPKRSPDGPQQYVEAFPGLDALAVERAVRANQPLCEWVDEAGRVVGHVRVIAWDVDRLDFEQRFGDVGAMLSSSGRRTIEIVREHRVKSHNRPSWFCKTCGEQVGKLFLAWGEWKCRRCHRRCYLSQRALPIVYTLRRHDYLLRRLDLGSDPFDTERERKAAEREFGELEIAVVNSRDYEIPRAVGAILFGEWMRLTRRPGLIWTKTAASLQQAKAEPAARPKAEPTRPPAIAPWFGDDTDDIAEDGFLQSSRFGRGL